MPEKKFYLESKLQEIGMRAQIVSFLIGHGVKEGNAMNDPENEKRVIVAVREDTEQKIEEIRKELVGHLNKLNKNDLCYGKFPGDITASGLMDLNNPHQVVLLRLSELSDSIMLEQTSKGVGAMRLLAETLKPLEERLKPLEGLKDLPNAIKELSQKIERI